MRERPPIWEGSGPAAAAGAAASSFVREFRLAVTSLPEAEIEVVSFEGVEAQNELYAFDVLWTARADLLTEPVSDLIGRRARLSMPTPHGVRCVHGIVTEAAAVATHERDHVYLARVAPALYRLSRARDSRVFQDMSVQQIAAEVLAQHGVAFDIRLAQGRGPRAYCTQYGESDLEFLVRLLAEEGIAFWFEHPPAEEGTPPDRAVERLVLADTDAFLQPLEGSARIPFRPETGALAPTGEAVVALRAGNALEPTRSALRRFDFLRSAPTPGRANPTPPAGHLSTLVGGAESAAFGLPGAESASAGGAVSGARPLEIYDPHGDDRDESVTPDLARLRLEQLRGRAAGCAGASTCRRLTPGATIEIEDQDVLPAGEEVAVVRVQHRGSNRGDSAVRYKNEFAGVPRGALFRPPPPARRFVQVVESAVVVGPENNAIHADDHGRIRVQFPWDRRGRNDEHSTCWVRVLQAWSGPAYGFQFIPRVGTEVLVSFLGGDPDRPVVTGCLPNPTRPLPYNLPEQITRSGVRTRSTPGDSGGYNELAFDDREGHELVFLRAQRNHEVLILNEHTVRVGKGQTTTVGEGRRAEVGGDEELHVGGARRVQVEGNAAEIVAGATLLQASARVVRVGGDDIRHVDGDAAVKVGGSFRLAAGTSEVEDAVIQASGEAKLVGARAIRLRSPGTIELATGDSTLTLTPDGITVRAKQITFEGTEGIKLVRGTSSVTIEDAIEVASDTVKLTAQAASLTLNQNAELLGTQIKLKNSSSAQASQRDRESAPAGQARFRVEGPPGFTGPFTVVVALPTGEVVERETDASGEVVLDGVEGDHFEIVELRYGSQRLSHEAAET
jgi:type VI secretion system secreted protein VgrG